MFFKKKILEKWWLALFGILWSREHLWGYRTRCTVWKIQNLAVVCGHLIAYKWLRRLPSQWLQLYFTCTGLERVSANEYERQWECLPLGSIEKTQHNWLTTINLVPSTDWGADLMTICLYYNMFVCSLRVCWAVVLAWLSFFFTPPLKSSRIHIFHAYVPVTVTLFCVCM